MVYQDGTYEEYTYQNNLMTSYTNRNGEMQKYVYSNEGLLLKLIDANNNSISYEYDVKGNLVKEKQVKASLLNILITKQDWWQQRRTVMETLSDIHMMILGGLSKKLIMMVMQKSIHIREQVKF